MEVEDKYLQYWRDRRRRQQEMNHQCAQKSRQEAQQMAEVLVQQFGATQVILFGSLARGRFTAESDIDLAVAGIAPSEFFTALAAANRLTNRWVDLKPLEALEPHFYQRVMETGEVLYARNVPH
ncbi:nucleotidyltransferase family protein [Egbenema bharatensis]|uniref:nucleotidyltransferase family protein n=1 Tax=Egbenema bharatensis TaxID=3463334 RepID=UPI003A851DAA